MTDKIMNIVTKCKIVLLGDAEVGKTAIKNTVIGRMFDTRYVATMGADVVSKTITVQDINMKFQIWDLAGQPHFEQVRTLYYRGAMGGILVFDLNKENTLDSIPLWAKELKYNSGKGAVPLIIAANKADLQNNPTYLSEEINDTIKLIYDINKNPKIQISHLITSAKTGQNIHQLFSHLGKYIWTFLGQKQD